LVLFTFYGGADDAEGFSFRLGVLWAAPLQCIDIVDCTEVAFKIVVQTGGQIPARIPVQLIESLHVRAVNRARNHRTYFVR
jgi:hypothetical protein